MIELARRGVAAPVERVVRAVSQRVQEHKDIPFRGTMAYGTYVLIEDIRHQLHGVFTDSLFTAVELPGPVSDFFFGAEPHLPQQFEINTRATEFFLSRNNDRSTRTLVLGSKDMTGLSLEVEAWEKPTTYLSFIQYGAGLTLADGDWRFKLDSTHGAGSIDPKGRVASKEVAGVLAGMSKTEVAAIALATATNTFNKFR